ncbi:MAG: hypothetical protein LBS89_06740 [Zoogloeaceae bacterium]|jgi:hypothetical protein|nr:hypothetical protein [Zoogloeaceae bacterium]
MAKKKNKDKRRKNAAQFGAFGGNNFVAGNNATGTGLFGGLAGVLPKKGRDKFLLGLALGAAATYQQSDETIRASLIKTGLKLYTGAAGAVEELKEQFADIQAELGAEPPADA